MDIAAIPIVDFLKYCKEGAISIGYRWIICILSRESDSRGLYYSIKRDWLSLDNITGRHMLVLFAGNEEHRVSDIQTNTDRYCVTDRIDEYVKRFNPFATVISERVGITANLSSSQRHDCLSDYLPRVEENQTDAIDSLRRYFKLREVDIPCLVYIPLYENNSPIKNIVVPLPYEKADLYGYFKEIFNVISPIIDDNFPIRTDKQSRIDNAYKELISLANQSEFKNDLLECISKRQYLSCKQPERGLLSRYIDLCNNYKKDTGEDYEPVNFESVDKLKTIEDVLSSIGISSSIEPVSDSYISIGNNNTLRNCKFILYINQINDDN